jgi:hypothetical protein
MISYLWIYDGVLDASGQRLTLDVEGPRMDRPGMASYQDIFEFVDSDHWILRSQILSDDGGWMQFLEVHHRRLA